MREYFEANRRKYRQLALLNVRHIEVGSKEKADEVYARLLKGGNENHFTLLGGQQSARSALHLAELFRLADRAGLLRNPERAALRMARCMALFGVED